MTEEGAYVWGGIYNKRLLSARWPSQADTIPAIPFCFQSVYALPPIWNSEAVEDTASHF